MKKNNGGGHLLIPAVAFVFLFLSLAFFAQDKKDNSRQYSPREIKKPSSFLGEVLNFEKCQRSPYGGSSFYGKAKNCDPFKKDTVIFISVVEPKIGTEAFFEPILNYKGELIGWVLSVQ